MRQAELAQKISVSEGFLSEVLSGKKEAFETRKKIVSIIEENMKDKSKKENKRNQPEYEQMEFDLLSLRNDL